MPPHFYPYEATLDEILFVLGEALCEKEIWSILLAGSIGLLKFLKNEDYSNRSHSIVATINPDTLLLNVNGTINFITRQPENANEPRPPPLLRFTEQHYMSPEIITHDRTSMSNMSKTMSTVEKMLIYSLGMCMLTSAEYCTHTSLESLVTLDLKSTLSHMVENNIATRISAAELKKICLQHIDIHSCASTVTSLAKEILGSLEGLNGSHLILPNPLKFNPVIPLVNGDLYNPVIPLVNGDITDIYNQGSIHSKLILPNPKDVLMNEEKLKTRAFDTGPTHMKPVSSLSHLTMSHYKDSDEVDIGGLSTSPPVESLDNKLTMEYNGAMTTTLISSLLPHEDATSDKSCNNSTVGSYSTVNHSGVAVNHNMRNDLHSAGDRRREMSRNLQHSGDNLSPPRRLSNGSYGTQASHNFSSQTSLTHGAYSLDGALHMDPGYPMQRFNSAGALSLSGTSLNSFNVPYGRSLEAMRKQQFSKSMGALSVSGSALPHSRSLDGGLMELDLSHLGPEFVRIKSDPVTAFVDITPMRLGPLPKKIRLVSVVLLNGQEIQTQVQVTAKGKDLFEQIASHIGLKEALYFGLALLEDEEYIFIDLDEKLTKHAPSGWKDEGNKKKKGEFVLHFRVKFFIENPRCLKHKLTSHFYYLQLRKSIASGHTHCPDDMLLILAGYSLQAEYGVFQTQFDGYVYFRLEHYFPEYVLSRVNPKDLYCNVSNIHRTLADKSQVDAELAFLDEAKNAEEYGLLFHKVSRSKDNTSDTVLLGICINGIMIKEHRRNQRKLVHQQSWDSIKKFYFEKKQFKLKAKTPEENPKMIFYTNHYRRSKHLFKMCQSFHRFQIYNQPLSKQSTKLKEEKSTTDSSIYSSHTNNKSGESGYKSDDIKFVQQQSEEKYNERSVDVHHVKTEPIRNKDVNAEPIRNKDVNAEIQKIFQNSEENFSGEDSGEENIITREDSLKLQRLSTYPKPHVKVNNVEVNKSDNESPPSSYSDAAVSDAEYVPMTNLKRAAGLEGLNELTSLNGKNGKTMDETSFSAEEEEDAIDANLLTQNLKIISRLEKMNKINSSHEYFEHEEIALQQLENSFINELSDYSNSTADDGESGGHSIIDEGIELAVRIVKKAGSFGFSITGGEDSECPLGGIYIKSLLPNGAASLGGRLKIGDRLISVGGVSLENVSHNKAVDILKQSAESSFIVVNRNQSIRPCSNVKSRLLAKVQHLKEITSQEIIFDAEVEKVEEGLGLCLAGGRNSDLVYKDQLMIRKIFPGLPIALSGKFQVGDILIAINDQIVEGMTHREALSTIRNASKLVTIIAKRPNANDIPDELFMTSRPVSPEKIMHDIRR